MCGGTETQFMTLGRLLDRTRFDLEFACLRRLGPFVQELAERQIPLREYRLATFRSVRALAQQARLARHISRRRIQIVHAYNFYGNVFAIPAARLVAPVVIASIRDCAPYLTALQKRVQRYACRLADCVLVNAEAVKEWLIGEGYDASSIVVIRNGVDLTRFTGAPDGDRVRHELGLAPGTPMITVVSRLARLKGLEHFLEAAALLAPRYPDARLLVVGDTASDEGAYRDELAKRAERLGIAGRVIFTGFRPDVPAVLGSAAVAVMPSLNEALSNVLLESMAAGAPVVATRVGGTPEALVDGVNGLLAEPGDSRALAAAIARLLDNRELASRLGRAARRSIENVFSVERMVRSTEQLYETLLASKPRQRLAGKSTTELTERTETMMSISPWSLWSLWFSCVTT